MIDEPCDRRPVVCPLWVGCPRPKLYINPTGHYAKNCFRNAAQKGNVELMKYLSLKYSKIESRTPDIFRLEDKELILYCAYGNLLVVKFLIEELQMNINDHVGRHCFRTAAASGKIKILKYLNSKNADLKNNPDKNQTTAMEMAITYSDLKTVQVLINVIGVNINETLGRGPRRRGRNYFFYATSEQKIEVMRFLHSKNPELKNYRDEYQDTALTYACRYLNLKTVKILIEEMKMNISETGRNGSDCFMSAVFNQKNKTLRYLDSIDPNLKYAQNFQNTGIDSSQWLNK